MSTSKDGAARKPQMDKEPLCHMPNRTENEDNCKASKDQENEEDERGFPPSIIIHLGRLRNIAKQRLHSELQRVPTTFNSNDIKDHPVE